jgi:hypothetical protein
VPEARGKGPNTHGKTFTVHCTWQTGISREALCRVPRPAGARQKKKNKIDGHLMGTTALPCAMTAWHTAKIQTLPSAKGVAHGKDWFLCSSNDIFAVCFGHCTRQSDHILCASLSMTYMVPQSLQAVHIYHNKHHNHFIYHNKHRRQFI